jgi:GR25 family glycosyltransferase involved in LPS biosynthesis
MYNIYYINLTRRLDRNKQMVDLLENNFKKPFNINYERIDAVDGLNLNIQELVNSNIIIQKPPEYILKRGQIGCSLSHINAWNLFIKSNYNYGIFFEDDIEINKQFFDETFSNTLSELEKITFDWCYLSMGRSDTYDGIKLNKYLYIPSYVGYGTYAYILSKEGANKLLKYYNTVKIYHPVDFAYRVRHDYPKIFNEPFKYISVYPDFLYYNYINYDKTINKYGKDYIIYTKNIGDSDTARIK